ncbi:C6 transcription factor-like protein [Paraphoma chrysanthemicola]|uniref:C6 transcription factor-like protein n=1 Tax=Paraphoma chrysanthemicola TaxID=798071 RepID=A0A8K0R9G4_9PLEO|nr:C6 transcription factor-like protein [Paraphoma chrysanthemicola]
MNMPSTPLGQRKVAIPRLQRPGQGPHTIKDRRRVPRACTACRSHKIKCTGERPLCKHCAATSRDCIYIMPRKDRLKIITERCLQMAGLLKGLRNSANAEDNVRIADILIAVEEETSELRQTTISDPDTDVYGSTEGREVCNVDQEHELSGESLDLLDENLHKDERARATGYVGKNSEVQWLRSVALAQAERPNEDEAGTLFQSRRSYAPGNEQVSTFSYWVDGEHVDVDFFVDPYELPPQDMADRLLKCYLLKVQDSFPIFPRKTFEDQFHRYFHAIRNGRPLGLSAKWQAILNLVFAIGAKYSHLSKASWRADERDHLIYQARARAFGMNEGTITNHSDLQQIQALGLLSFYWLTTGQVSRAWTVIGLALRFGYSLGLHVRNEDPSATASTRETLVRTWWSLYSLERTLSIITGRPSMIADSCCSVPLPLPVAEDNITEDTEATLRLRKRSTTTFSPTVPTFANSSTVAFESPGNPIGPDTMEPNSGSYFKAAVQLSIITQSVLTSLYSAETMIRSHAELQQDMSQLSLRLDLWINSLPLEFNFQRPPSESSEPFMRERTLLGFKFCSAKMLLTRPCLTARRSTWREANEISFAKRMANACLDAAITVVKFLPNEPRSDLIAEHGPWWCIVHHVMQAVSVILLALSHSSTTSHDPIVLIQSTKKAVCWLRIVQDPVAERASHVALGLLDVVARRYGIDVSDLWNLGIGDVLNPRGHPDLPVSDAFMPPCLPAHIGSMAAPPTAHATIGPYTGYDAVMTDPPFSPHYGVANDSGSYYMARS